MLLCTLFSYPRKTTDHTMKIFLSFEHVLLSLIYVISFIHPVYAESPWNFGSGQIRCYFDHGVLSSVKTDEQYTLREDVDVTWNLRKDNLEMYVELELANEHVGEEQSNQSLWNMASGKYGAKWTPAFLDNNQFSLEIGNIGPRFGKSINNSRSSSGSIELAWKLGNIDLALGYGRTADNEREKDDFPYGAGHLVNGQVHFPLGKTGFNLGAYAAMYAGSDMLFTQMNQKGDIGVVLGSVELSGKIRGFDMYSEVGFAAGNGETSYSETTASKKIDLSGFYAIGGTNVDIGQVTLGIEAGFASGDDNPNDNHDQGFTSLKSDFGLGEILHDEGFITRMNGGKSGLSNLIYAQIQATMLLLRKIGVSGGLLYLTPAETVTSPYTNKAIETYGMEVFGGVNYEIADYIKYYFDFGFALPDQNFLKDNPYQITNGVEIKF